MKAIKKFLALLLTAVMAFTVVPVFAAQSSSVPEKALSAGRLYGYRVFDDDDTLSYAWISFTADNPAAVTEEQVEENAFDDYTDMNCGAYVNGYVYGFAENGYFYRVNTADWSREKAYVGPGLYGETVALIGAGAISTCVQEMLKAFNVNVIVVPSRPERRTVSLEEVFQKAFVVSNHLPNRDDNIGVLNGKLFSSMRHGAVFINTGRGAQVNEAELIEVLEKRPDLTALLDVTHPEPPAEGSKLYTLPNVQQSSHIAGSVNDEVHRMADYMLDEFRRYIAGEPLKYQVVESMLLTSTK